MRAEFPHEQERATVRLGLAAGDWRTLAVHHPPWGTFHLAGAVPPEVWLGPPYDAELVHMGAAERRRTLP